MALLREFRPDVVKGYASSLFMLASDFGEALRELEVRLVFSGAEFSDVASRKMISSRLAGNYLISMLVMSWSC